MEPNTVPEIRYCSECGQPTPADELARFGEHMVCPNCKNSYAQKLREGVSPNLAAAAGFRYAGFWIRFLAYVIDAIILGVVTNVVNMIFFGSAIRAMMEQAANPTEMLGLMRTVGLASLSGM